MIRRKKISNVTSNTSRNRDLHMQFIFSVFCFTYRWSSFFLKSGDAYFSAVILILWASLASDNI